MLTQLLTMTITLNFHPCASSLAGSAGMGGWGDGDFRAGIAGGGGSSVVVASSVLGSILTSGSLGELELEVGDEETPFSLELFLSLQMKMVLQELLGGGMEGLE